MVLGFGGACLVDFLLVLQSQCIDSLRENNIDQMTPSPACYADSKLLLTPCARPARPLCRRMFEDVDAVFQHVFTPCACPVPSPA